MSTAPSLSDHENAVGGRGPGRLKHLALIALTVALSMTVGLLLAEVILRVIGVKSLPPRYGDADLGLAIQRNMDVVFDFPEYGGKLHMRTNNLGFHQDQNVSPDKRPGEYRLAFVGDSQTAGECANNENYPAVVGRRLNSLRTGDSVDVLNAGVGRFSPYQYYIRAKRDVLPLNPDQIVVGLYLGNDYMDLIRHDDRPYLTITSKGQIEAHRPEFIIYDDPSEPPGFLLSSRLYSLVRSALGPNLYYQYSRARILLEGLSGSSSNIPGVATYMIEVKRLTDVSLGLMTQSLAQKVWFSRFPETYAAAAKLNKHVMELFKALCDAHHIRLTYVLIPTKVQIEPQEVRSIFARIGKIDPILTAEASVAFENRIADDVLAAGRELGVEVIDPRAEMVEHLRGIRRYYPEEMHLNPAGNELIGEVLAGRIAGKLAARSPDGSN